jgi:hypothetical protein
MLLDMSRVISLLLRGCRMESGLLWAVTVLIHGSVMFLKLLTLRRLLLGKAEIGSWKDGEGNEICMPADKEMAIKTMRKLRELGEMEGVHVAMAHVHLDEVGDEKLKSLLLQSI